MVINSRLLKVLLVGVVLWIGLHFTILSLLSSHRNPTTTSYHHKQQQQQQEEVGAQHRKGKHIEAGDGVDEDAGGGGGAPSAHVVVGASKHRRRPQLRTSKVGGKAPLQYAPAKMRHLHDHHAQQQQQPGHHHGHPTLRPSSGGRGQAGDEEEVVEVDDSVEEPEEDEEEDAPEEEEEHHPHNHHHQTDRKQHPQHQHHHQQQQPQKGKEDPYAAERFPPPVVIYLKSPPAGDVNSEGKENRPTSSGGFIHFPIIGDWGGPGRKPQRQVAAAMQQTANTFATRCPPPSSSAASRPLFYHGKLSKAQLQQLKTGELGCYDFVVSTGDNMYEDGIASIHDPKLKRNFERVYTQPAASCRWYMSLGNHDHGAHGVMRDVMAEVNYTRLSKKWFLPATYYAQSFHVLPDSTTATSSSFDNSTGAHNDDTPTPTTAPDASSSSSSSAFDLQLIVLDTYDVSPRLTKMTDGQLQWFEEVLKDAVQGAGGKHAAQSPPTDDGQKRRAVAGTTSTTNVPLGQSDINSKRRWRIVVGHRPLFSAGAKHGSSPYMQKKLLPLMKKYNVSAYLSGDDHELQLLESEGVTFVLSGGGARAKSDLKPGGVPQTVFQYGGHGFVLASLARDELQLRFVDKEGKVIHTHRVRSP